MIRRPPRSTRTDTLFPYTPLFRSLLLPIWKRLPQESSRVYRLQADDDERIVGRRVAPAWVATATANDSRPTLDPQAAFTALMEGRQIPHLDEGLPLRRARAMGVNRTHLSGFTDAMRQRLTAHVQTTEPRVG